MNPTPRQIEVLTEIFEGKQIDYHDMTPSQRNGRRRVLDGMSAHNPKQAFLESSTRTITLRGLRALEPHYPDKAKIAAAIEVRAKLEDEREAAEALERRQRAEREQLRRSERAAALVKGYRAILEDHHFDAADRPDDLILSLGNSIADLEART